MYFIKSQPNLHSENLINIQNIAQRMPLPQTIVGPNGEETVFNGIQMVHYDTITVHFKCHPKDKQQLVRWIKHCRTVRRLGNLPEFPDTFQRPFEIPRHQGYGFDRVITVGSCHTDDKTFLKGFCDELNYTRYVAPPATDISIKAKASNRALIQAYADQLELEQKLNSNNS